MVNARILQNHPVAAAVVALLDETPEWWGTPTQLLEDLAEVAGRDSVCSKVWPKSANALSRWLNRNANHLAAAGIKLETGKDTAGVRGRYIRLTKNPAILANPGSKNFITGSQCDATRDDTRDGTVTFLCVHRRATYVLRPATKEDKGKRAEFHNGRLVTADPEIIAFLRRHPDYGTKLTELREPF